MNRVRQFFAATILTLAITFTGFAGEMHTGITNPPPTQPSATGEMGSPGATTSDTSTSETAAMDSVTDVALYLFDSIVHSVF